MTVVSQEQKNSLTGKFEGSAKDSTGETKATLELPGVGKFFRSTNDTAGNV